ncbi:MAG: hypothetical protein R2715_05580 [Ilumatobacteraceae bacterium]
MQCPICATHIDENARACPDAAVGCSRRRPGAEPVAFVREGPRSRWPLIAGIVGVVAALAVIAI